MKGQNICLRHAKESDASQIIQWWNDPSYMGEYQDTTKLSDEQIQNIYGLDDGSTRFIIEKASKGIEHISAWKSFAGLEIGFAIIPNERGKRYGTEAIRLMIDHLFETRKIARIQARTRTDNIGSHKALERPGFVLEGVIRKGMLIKGEFRDMALFSILRDDWGN